MRRTAAYERCASLAVLHQSLVDEVAAAGLKVVEHVCDAANCSMDRQLSAVSDAASESDVVLLVPWQAYRNGLNVKCHSESCLRVAVSALFSFSEDASRCSGAARALSLPFVEATCQEVVAGELVDGFIVNPSPALAADAMSLLPSEAFRTALRTIFADQM